MNYLIPTDAKFANEADIEFEVVGVGYVIAQMRSADNPMNIVILDACRNNPFANSYRSVELSVRGLASMDMPTGTLIAYATAPGSIAIDGTGRNGIYTQELLKNIRTPDLTIEEMFRSVRRSVRDLTNGKQIPWESSSLVDDFYFVNKKVISTSQEHTTEAKTPSRNSQPMR